MPNFRSPLSKFPAAVNPRKLDYISNSIVIFNDLEKVPLYDTPTRIDHTIIGICLRGYNLMGVDDKMYRTQPGTMIIATPSQRLQSIKYSKDFSGVFVVISQQLANEIYPWIKVLIPIYKHSKRRPCVMLTDEELSTMMEYFSLLWKKIIAPNHSYRNEVLTALILSVFYEIHTIYKRLFPDITPKEITKEKIFNRFIQELEQHYTKEKTVGFYARQLKISSKYLNAAVKDYSGQAPSTWIDSYIIYEAKMQLLTPAYEIGQIARRLNFRNPSNFSKYFRRYTGYKPRDYRKLHTGLIDPPVIRKMDPYIIPET